MLKPMKQHIQTKLKTKQKIEKNKETVRPTVINDVLIQQYMVDYNRENKIFDDDDRQIWELTHLSLSFLSKLPESALFENRLVLYLP